MKMYLVPSLRDGFSNIRLEYLNPLASAGSGGAQITFAQPYLSGNSSLIRTGAIRGVKTEASGNYGGGVQLLYNPSGNVDMAVGLTLNHQGYVGIGTITPSSLLHVKSAINAHSVLTIDNTTLGYNSVIQFNEAGSSKWAMGLNKNTVNGTLDFYDMTNNQPRVTFTQSGNVGIGTSTPASRLEVYSATNAGLALDGYGSRWTITSASSNTLWIQNSTLGSNNIRINSTGMGVGTGSSISPATSLHVGSFASGVSEAFRLTNAYTATNGTGVSMMFNVNRTTSGLTNVANIAGLITDISDSAYKGALIFSTANNAAPAERMRIDYLGNVGIGTSTPTQKLSVVGNAQFTAVGSGAYAYDLNLTSDGTLTTSASDERLKNNIVSLNSSSTLEKIIKLNPVSFTWKNGNAPDVGLIAQQVESIFPEVVFTNPTDGYKGVNYSRLITLLVSAVQEVTRTIAGFANEFVTKKLKTDVVETQTLCIDDVCVSKDQLKKLLNQNNIQGVPQPPVVTNENTNTGTGGLDIDNNINTNTEINTETAGTSTETNSNTNEIIDSNVNSEESTGNASSNSEQDTSPSVPVVENTPVSVSEITPAPTPVSDSPTIE